LSYLGVLTRQCLSEKTARVSITRRKPRAPPVSRSRTSGSQSMSQASQWVSIAQCLTLSARPTAVVGSEAAVAMNWASAAAFAPVAGAPALAAAAA